MFILFVNKGIFKVINAKIMNIFRINNGTIYELPNMSNHLINYKETLSAKKR